MSTYYKKPVKIEAIQWTGDNLRQVMELIGRNESSRNWTWEYFNEVVKRDGLKIFTLEGTMSASVGDYIIKGVKGECYPCKPDIFEMTYTQKSELSDLREQVKVLRAVLTRVLDAIDLTYSLGASMELWACSSVRKACCTVLEQTKPKDDV